MKQLTGILAVLVVCSGYTQAQIIYSSGLEDGTGWAIVAEEDTNAQWGWGLVRPLGLPRRPTAATPWDCGWPPTSPILRQQRAFPFPRI